MAIEKLKGWKLVFASRKMVAISGILFFTRNTEKNPLIIFPNEMIKKLRKHAFVKVNLLYIIQSFSDHSVTNTNLNFLLFYLEI